MTRGAQRSGFTLIELLVVLVLLAVTSAAAIPAILGDRLVAPEERAATTLANALERARDVARESGSPTTLVLAPADGRFWIAAGASLVTGVLPLSRAAYITDAPSARVECRFEPTGPATPCAFTIRGARSLTVSVNGWTGAIHVGGHRAA